MNPGQQALVQPVVQPVLQRQDGNFVGTASTSVGTSMIGFTASGGQLFNVPNDTPQIATSDGGVIGASGTTYDQNGKANGQNATLLVGGWPGWLANPLSMSYSITSGIVTGSAFVPIGYATTFAALQGGNNSGTGTNVQQEWFPELPSCPLAPPGQPPCAKEAIRDALAKLRTKMLNSCSACSTYVFNILGSNQTDFYNYLARAPRLFDGTRSNAPANVLCPSGFTNWLFCGQGSESVSSYMQQQQAAAVSQTPSDSGEGPMIFFDPVSICNSVAGGSMEALNEAALFHESLHGYYDKSDDFLRSKFHANNPIFGSVEITYYLENNIFGYGLRYKNDVAGTPGALECPQ